MSKNLIFLVLAFLFLFLNLVLSQANQCQVTVEAGGPYIKTSSSPKILIAGNVSYDSSPASDANTTIKIYEDGTPKATKELTASSGGKFFAIFENLDKGNYTTNVTANYSSSVCNASDEFEIKESLSGCEQKNISLAGLARDFLTGEAISGTLKVLIKESGDEYSKGFESGKWSLNFTTCLLPDQRHTAVIQVLDTKGRKAWIEVQFRV